MKVMSTNVDPIIKTLKRDKRTCHDSSKVFSLRIETRYLNRIFWINGASLFVFLFIATTVNQVEICTKVAKLEL